MGFYTVAKSEVAVEDWATCRKSFTLVHVRLTSTVDSDCVATAVHRQKGNDREVKEQSKRERERERKRESYSCKL